MKAFDLCTENYNKLLFTVGNGRTVWESAVYNSRNNKVIISRGEKGIRISQISPDVTVNLLVGVTVNE